MKIEEAMIVWNPGQEHQVDVVKWPDRQRVGAGLRYSCGACDTEWHEDAEKRLLLLFIHFNTLVVRDRISPLSAHRAFLKIDEYRRRISPDQEGAE